MKKLLLSCFLLLQINPLNEHHEAVIFNLNTDTFYLVEYTDTLTSITLRYLDENTRLPIACMNNEIAPLRSINFSASPKCLMNTLNNAFHLNIDSYVDLQNQFSLESLKTLAENKKLVDLLQAIQSVRTNVSLTTFYSLYNAYTKLDELKLTHEYPTLIKNNNDYLPLSNFEAEKKRLN